MLFIRDESQGGKPMLCSDCQRELPADARFCPACGRAAGTGIHVSQDVGTVEGSVIGLQAGETPAGGLTSHTQQKVDTVKEGGTVVGTVVGGSGTTTIGGQHTHGDTITTGDIRGGGIAIGRGARSTVRNVHTGGGDYAEGSIDKRKGTFVSGDQFNLSGNFSGAILNIKSTLTNVSQSIGASPHGDAAAKAQLQALIEQLSTELQKVSAEQEDDAEAVAETAKAAVEQATKANPNKTLVQISAEGLKQAAQNLTSVLPDVLPIAIKIATAVTGFVA